MEHSNRHFGWIAHSTGILVLLIAVGAFVLAVYRPLAAAKVAAQERMVELEELLGKSDATQSSHRQLSVTLEELEERSQTIRRRVPARAEEAEFLRGLSNLADESQLAIQDYRRKGVENLPSHSELELTVTAEGSYESICRFLHGLESMPRIATVRRLLINAKTSDGRYGIDFTLVLYFDLKQQAASRQGGRHA